MPMIRIVDPSGLGPSWRVGMEVAATEDRAKRWIKAGWAEAAFGVSALMPAPPPEPAEPDEDEADEPDEEPETESPAEAPPKPAARRHGRRSKSRG